MTFTARVALLTEVVCFLQVYLVGSQITAYEGQTVVLPCNLTAQGDTLIWKDEKNKNVLKVKGGQVVAQAHDRVTFLNKHSTGNFSIQISNVNVNDSGRYECHLETSRKYVQLKVIEGKTEEAEMESDGPVQPEGGAVVPQLSACVLVLLIGFLLM